LPSHQFIVEVTGAQNPSCGLAGGYGIEGKRKPMARSVVGVCCDNSPRDVERYVVVTLRRAEGSLVLTANRGGK
jgi:hypothetical protein